MSRQQIIDKIANNRIRLITELCHDAANQCPAARVPLQVDRSMNIASTVYFRPAMRTAGLFMPDFDKTEFFFQLLIAHDFVPQGSGPGRAYLNYGLHSLLSFSRKPFLLQSLFNSARPRNKPQRRAFTEPAIGTSHKHRRNLYRDDGRHSPTCRRFQTRGPAIDGSHRRSWKLHN